MSSFFVIPRDLYATLKATNKPSVFANAILVLNELAFRVRYNGNLSDAYEIGQCSCGTYELAEQLGISRQNVRTALNVLEKVTTIQPTTNHQLTTVTILDKRIFSASFKHNQPATNQQLTTNIHIHKQIQKKDILSGKPDFAPLCLEILEILNKALGKNYRPVAANLKHIASRIKEGYVLEDFVKVVRSKQDEWIGTNMEIYLRPETLFGPKFDSYLQTAKALQSESNKW